MASNRYSILNAEIKTELAAILKLRDELNTEINNINLKDISSFEIRGFGSLLHDIYTALERIFRRIAKNIDEDLPQGENWHIELLNRMSLEIQNVRIHVISTETREELHEYLRFRHIFRHTYGYDLKWEKMEKLISNLNACIDRFLVDFNSFSSWLVNTQKEIDTFERNNQK